VSFKSLLLYAADGRIRRTTSQAGGWDSRTVVFAAAGYQDAHEVAAGALLVNWSSQPYEVEVHAVRPATAADLAEFKYPTDPALRVFVEVAA
jgi:hypothetical protein